MGIFAVDADVEIKSGAVATEALDGGFVGVAAIDQGGGGRAEARGNGGAVGCGLAHGGGADAHALADDELAAVGIDDGLGVVALGIALAFAFAHEARVGVAQIDLLVGLGRVARGLGLGAFGGAMPLGARVVQRHILYLSELNDAPGFGVQIRLEAMRLERPRQWGACWLFTELWAQLQLDEFWRSLLPDSREGTS